MKIISIGDIESLILLKAEIEQYNKLPKISLDDFVKKYIVSSESLCTYVTNNGDTIYTFSMYDFKDDLYVFNIQELDNDLLTTLVNKVSENKISEVSLDKIDLNNNYFIIKGKYYVENIEEPN